MDENETQVNDDEGNEAGPTLGESGGQDENARIEAEGLNKIVQFTKEQLDAISAQTKTDKDALLFKLANQLGLVDAEKAEVKKLLKIAKTCCVELFHTADEAAYATVKINDRLENLAIDSRKFAGVLSRAFYQKYEKPPSATVLAAAIGYLRASACIDGKEHKIFVRVGAGDDGCIYYDLADKEWRAVKISSDGWAVIKDPPVKFIRPAGMLAQCEPVASGHIDDLWQFINCEKQERVLALGWLVQALRPVGPYPSLILNGGQGSGKSFAQKCLKLLIDPTKAPLRLLPDSSRDLLITARNSWCLSYDNLSKLTDHMSDDFCRLATGGGSATRELYTNTDEVIIDVQRPVLLNGIPTLAKRLDLMERAITLSFNSLVSGQRKLEKDLEKAFAEKRGELLGCLFDLLSVALSNFAATSCDKLLRMADFMTWVKAAESRMPFKVGDFESAYIEQCESAVEMRLENDGLAIAVRRLLDGYHDESAETVYPLLDKYTGTTRELLSELKARADFGFVKSGFFPSERTLKDRLVQLQGSLLTIGIDYQFLKHTRKGSKHSISKTTGKSVTSVIASQGLSDKDFGGLQSVTVCDVTNLNRHDVTDGDRRVTDKKIDQSRGKPSTARISGNVTDVTTSAAPFIHEPSLDDENFVRDM